MRSGMILLCYLGVILKPSQSLPFQFVNVFQFHPTNSSPSENDQHYGYITDVTDSSITFIIILFNYTENKLGDTVVYYEPSNHQELFTLPTLTLNRNTNFYVAKEIHGIFCCSMMHHRSESPSLQETIVIPNLVPDTEYVFNITSYRENNTWREEKIVRKTRPVHPPILPRTGLGLFRIYNVSEDGTRRSVKIYWQFDRFNPIFFKAFCHEFDGNFTRVFQMKGHTSFGSIRVNISLGHHIFLIHCLDYEGDEVTDIKIIDIPAQKDIEPPLQTLVYSKKIKKTLTPLESALRPLDHSGEEPETFQFLLTWTVPQNTNVTSYTVAWYDTKDIEGGFRNVIDFVYLDKDERSFKVESDKWVGLAISVNNENNGTISSGLHPASYDEHGYWPISS